MNATVLLSIFYSCILAIPSCFAGTHLYNPAHWIQYLINLLPPVLWYSIGNWGSLSLAFHNLNTYWGYPSNSAVFVQLENRIWCQKLPGYQPYGELAWPTFLVGKVMHSSSYVVSARLANLPASAATTGATDFVATAFVASVGAIASSADTWPARMLASFVALPQNASRWLTSKWTRRVFCRIHPSLLSRSGF